MLDHGLAIHRSIREHLVDIPCGLFLPVDHEPVDGCLRLTASVAITVGKLFDEGPFGEGVERLVVPGVL